MAVIALLLLGCMSAPAHALKNPTQAEIDALVLAVKHATRQEDLWDNLKQYRDTTSTAANALKKKDPGAYARKLAEVNAAQVARQQAYDAVIHQTIAAWDLGPGVTATSVVGGPHGGETSSKKVLFSEILRRSELPQNGDTSLDRARRQKKYENTGGWIGPDGTIQIRPVAIPKAAGVDRAKVDVASLGYLASILDHEFHHYKELVTTGWGYDYEVTAYRRQKQMANFFGLSPVRQSWLDQRIDKEVRDMNLNELNRNWGFDTDPYQEPLGLIGGEAGSDFGELESIRLGGEQTFDAGLPDIADRIARRAEAFRKGKEREHEDEMQAIDERTRRTLWRLYQTRWDLLVALTEHACRDPFDFRNHYRNRPVPELLMPEGFILAKLKRHESSFNGCEKEVVAFLIAARGPVQLRSVADVAWQSMSLGDVGVAVGRFFKSIQDKLAAVGRVRPAPPSGSGPPRGDDPSRGRDRVEVPPERDPIEFGHSPTLDRLKGIDGGIGEFD